ncbi:unnamed protein product, partial [Rotaria sp. Silwood1]
ISSLWVKAYERIPLKKQDAPFANDESNDSLEDNPTMDDNDEYESKSDTSLPIQISLPNLNINTKFQPWETLTKQDFLVIIINTEQNIDNCTVI